MPKPGSERLEGLLADALAAHDEKGQGGLEAFLRAHADERSALERGLARCRQLGLLGDAAPARDFPERLGEFRLLRRLGSGGMGVVYEAEQESLGRRVALKVVRPELLYFEGARERFRREIEAVARLSHPAVVPVLASGEQDGVPWYAMELLHGHTVHEVCETLAGRDPATLRGEDLRAAIGPSLESGTDPLLGAWWQVCVRITHAVALGVRHAHLRGIVHRDIKPSNVMLTTDGSTVLLDFGVAMLGGGREVTRTGATPGSPAFMSPEQLRGDAVDERTDVYSLAATLWQMLTLVPPFRGDADLQRIREGDVPAVTAHNREVPRELVLVLRKAMDRDRERRYVDVEHFAQDLVAVLQRRPIQARRLDLSLRVWRWCQRHRVLATVAASSLVVTLALPGVFAWRERETNRELNAAFALVNDSFTTTLDAIDQMLVTLARKELRFVPAAAAATRAALERACAMYRELLQRYPAHDRLRRDTAVALNSLAELTLQSGDRAGAQELYEESLTRLGPGEIADPDVLDSRAAAHLNLARLHSEFRELEAMRRQLDEAARDYRALANQERWLGNAKTGLAQVALLQCELPEQAKDAAARLASLRTCVALSREAFALQGGMPARRVLLVQNLNNLATAEQAGHDGKAAMALLGEALDLLDGMPADARVWPTPRVLRSGLLQTRGTVRQEAGDPAAADDFAAAIELLEAERASRTDDIELACRLGGSLHNAARMDCGDDATAPQLERALVRLQRAIELERDVLVRSPGYERARAQLMLHLRLRGNCLARLQRRAELVEVATELRGDDRNANHLRATARFWLRAAEMLADEAIADAAALRARYEENALDALLAAERAGWQSRSKLDEVVYAPLARLPEFARLRERLQAGAAPAGARDDKR